MKIWEKFRSWRQSRCSHNWVLSEKTVYDRTADGNLMASAKCQCKKCGKIQTNRVELVCLAPETIKRLREAKQKGLKKKMKKRGQ